MRDHKAAHCYFSRLKSLSRNNGAALLTAMLTVALIASLATGALWQQWRDVEIEAAERSRAQSIWVLTGALDWARLILREDARTGGADHLGEPWAVPLAEARLSTFLAVDKNTTSADEASVLPQVFLSGQIVDLQSRLNVINLVDGGKVSEPAQAAFGRLFEGLGLAPAELDVLASNLKLALDPAASAQAPLMPQRIAQLGWLGLSPASITALQPYITLLPVRTPVNLNTAAALVLFASIPKLDMAQAERMVTSRQSAQFLTLGDARKLIGEPIDRISELQHSVNSRFFEVRGQLRHERSTIEEYSVVERNGQDVKTLWRDRGSLPPLPPATLQ